MCRVGVLVPLGCCKKIPQTVRFNKQEKCISHASEGWKSKIRIPVLLGSGEGPLLGCRLLAFCSLHLPEGLGSPIGSLL